MTLNIRLFLLSLFFSAFTCANAAAAPLKIVASFSILADMVREVAGDNAEVMTLIGPDSDPHAFEPMPANAKAVANADMVVVNGLGFEGWLDRLTSSTRFRGRIVVASTGLHPLTLDQAPDPHAWQDVANGEIYVANIQAALMKADPVHAAAYAENARRYLRELAALDIWVRSQIKAIPPDKRIAISSHDALHYFAAAYGVTFIAPLGLSTSGDVSAGTIARLIDQIRARRVRAVFMENMTDPRLIRQLVADGGAVVGGTLYSDALSGPDGPAPTYIAMFRHNVGTMTAAMIKN